MIGTVAVTLNRLPTAKLARFGTAGARKADEASPWKPMADACPDSRTDIPRRSGTMAEKAGLETIGVLPEPTLDDLLSEPIVAALMKADGVDPVVLKATIREQAGLRRRSVGNPE